MRNNRDMAVYRQIADDNGLSLLEVKKAIASFFDMIAIEAKSLPFDNPRKIFSNKAFKQYEKIYCLPHLGRIGTSHSRYLKWRANESKKENMVPRSSYHNGLSEEDIEAMAMEALSGKKVKNPNKRRTPFKRVWLVDIDGKKQARQVIPKEKKNV